MSDSGYFSDDGRSVFSRPSIAPSSHSAYSYYSGPQGGKETSYISPEPLATYANTSTSGSQAGGIEAWLDDTAAAQDVDTLDDFDSDVDPEEEEEESAPSSAWRTLVSVVSSVEFWSGVVASTLFPEAGPAVLGVSNAALKALAKRAKEIMLGMSEKEVNLEVIQKLGTKMAKEVVHWDAPQISRAVLDGSERESARRKGQSWRNSLRSIKASLPFT